MPTTEGLPPLRLALLLRLLHREYALAVEDALAQAGFGDIRSGEAKVFPFVPDAGIPVTELAQRAGVRKQTMAQSVDHLERAGYLERRPNIHDGRSRLVFLTERGRKVQPAVAASGDAVEQHWGHLVSPEDLETVRRLLRRLLGRIAETNPAAEDRLFSAAQ